MLPSRPLTLALALAGTLIAQAAPDAGAGRASSTVAPSGLDPAFIDRSVRPGDDFFRYANGTWLAKHRDPARPRGVGRVRRARGAAPRADAGSSSRPPPRSNAARGSLERKMGDFYASAMDEAAIEAKGLAPLQAGARAHRGARRRGATSPPTSARSSAPTWTRSTAPTSRPRDLFGLWVAPDLNDPVAERALPPAGRPRPAGPRLLPRSTAPRWSRSATKYRAHVETDPHARGHQGRGAARGRGWSPSRRRWPRSTRPALESLEVKKANNPWPRAEFGRRGRRAWTGRASSGRRARRDSRSSSPGTRRRPQGLSALVRDTSRSSAGRTGATVHAIDRRARLPRQGVPDEAFAFYGTRALRDGRAAPRAGSGRRLASTTSLGEAVGRLYVERHFPPEAKAKAAEMVKIHRRGVRPPHRRARLDGAVHQGAGQGEARRRSTSASATPTAGATGRARGPARRPRRQRGARRALPLPARAREARQAGRPDELVHAPARGQRREPAGAQRAELPGRHPPAALLRPDAPAAVNYGVHRRDHRARDQPQLRRSGRARSTPTGKLENWWTKEDLAHFEASGAQLAAQYDAYRPFPDLHVNGKQTLSENIADLAGLAAAHDAWRHRSAARRRPWSRGFNGEQQFFLAYAQSWRTKCREPAAAAARRERRPRPGRRTAPRRCGTSMRGIRRST